MSEAAGNRIADEVYGELRREILSGVLTAGSRLSVPAISERIKVGRSPVREAVLRLVQERLASEEPRRGAVVAQVGPRELAALYEVRLVLEGLAAQLAVENAGQSLVRALRGVLEEHARAVESNDLARHEELDIKFHSLVRHAAQNPELIRFLDDIQAQVRLAMQTTRVLGGPHQALEDHRIILEAIASGNPEVAEKAARAHVARLREMLLAVAVGKVLE